MQLTLRSSALVATKAKSLLRRTDGRTLVAAGVLDAGMASMASFAAAIYAARFLEPTLLGAYAVFFSAFVVLGFVPANLYLLQARVEALVFQQHERIAVLPQTLLSGALFSGAAALVMPLAGASLVGHLPLSRLAPLAVTAAAMVFLSPLQDHLRATCHMAGRSSRAVIVSACQLVVVALALVTTHFGSVAPQYIPFGALALANSASLAVGLWLSRSELRSYSATLPPLKQVIRPGWSLLLAAIVPVAGQFAGSALVASFRSAADAGYAEAARVVAMPVHVAALGLAQALTPMMMEAAQSGSLRDVKHARRIFLLPLAACSLIYLPVVGLSHFGNPMWYILPTAYHLTGLVVLSAASILALDVALIPRAELAGAQRARELVGPSVIGAAVHVLLVLALMWSIGGYVIPLGVLVSNSIALVLTWRRAQRLVS